MAQGGVEFQAICFGFGLTLSRPLLSWLYKILIIGLLGFLLSLILLMLNFVKPGCLISVGLVILMFLLTIS